jgi:uncharacterized delta-60 repeat protein
MALQADGKIVLTGEFLDSQSNWYFGAYRLTANGDLDRSFGEGGWVDTKVGGIDLPHAVEIQRDGKILLAGESICGRVTSCAVVIRYLPSGALDRAFGGNGVVTLSGRIRQAKDVAIQPNGRILVLGSKSVHTSRDDFALFSVVRLLPSGRLDRSFSHDGFAHIGTRRGQAPNGLALQRDGKILIAGTVQLQLPNWGYMEIARLRRDGRPDRTFSHDGLATVDFPGRDDGAGAIAVQRDGRIVVAGSSGIFVQPWTTRIALIRLTRNGALDRSFGKRLASAGRYGSAAGGVFIGPDGRILVAGVRSDDRSDYTSAWAVLRYLPNGRLDHRFGRRGVVIGDFGTGRDWASTVLMQPDGKILVGGSIYEDEAVARFFSR